MKITKKKYTELVKFYENQFNVRIDESEWESNDFHMNGIFIPDIRSKSDKIYFNNIEVLNIHYSEFKTTYHINSKIDLWVKEFLNFEFNELEYYKEIKNRYENNEILLYCRETNDRAEEEYLFYRDKVKELSK